MSGIRVPFRSVTRWEAPLPTWLFTVVNNSLRCARCMMHSNTHDSSEYFRIYDEGETIVPMREYSADVYEVRPVSCEDRDQALPYRNMHTGQFPISFQCHCPRLVTAYQWSVIYTCILLIRAVFICRTSHPIYCGYLLTNCGCSCNSPPFPFSYGV